MKHAKFAPFRITALRITALRITVLVAAVVAACFLASPALAARPNVVFFLVDDLGWTDLGCQGSKFYETPHVDSLARDGNWKLIENYADGVVELYDLETDIGELTDLSAMQPQRVEALHTTLKTWRNDVGAKMPSPNPKFRASPPPAKNGREK
jgi:hypothetical protein